MPTDDIKPGYYQIKAIKNGPWLGARIHCPCQCTPTGGDEQREHEWRETCDRPKVFVATMDGKETDPLKISLFGEPISRAKYEYLIAARPYSGAADKALKPDRIDPRRFAP